MGNGENKPAGSPVSGDDQLAKDVARLYAWANVESIPYRDFSRQRKIQHRSTSAAGDDQRVEASGVSSKVPVQDGAAFEAATAVETPVPALNGASSPEIHQETAPIKARAVISDAAPMPQPAEPESPFTVARLRGRSRFVDQVESHAQGANRPALAVHSLAGGVGKTTLCANLARVLCSLGEQVLLVDASGSGILPFYFGANDLRPGLRKFVAPGMTYSPLRVLGSDEVTREWLGGEVQSAMPASDRIIFDLGPASFGLLPDIFRIASTILIPLLPDLNSILTIPRVEASLEKMRASGIQAPSPFYIFSEFDNESAIDQRARELVARQCGDRLLPITIRYGAEVGQAIADRMTVVDYAPESEVTHDYVELAAWVQSVAPATQARKSAGRWTEQ